MNENSFISFIVPSYNSENSIEKCLESIQNVDYLKNNFEIIIVDNGSKDGTVDIAKRFTDKIFIDNTATIAKLRNDGAKKSKGDFLVFLDSDCLLPKDWLINASEHFKDPAVVLVGSTTIILPGGDSWIDKAWKVHLDSIKANKQVMWIVSRAMAVRRDVFFLVGGFDESLVTCEDVDFGYRVSRKYKVISDKRLAPLHLKTINTLVEFFKKESWRGKDSLRVSLKYIKKWKEILSFASLMYYFILILLIAPSLALSLILRNMLFISLILICITLPLIIITFNTCLTKKQFSYFWKLLVLYGVYILARLRAIFQ